MVRPSNSTKIEVCGPFASAEQEIGSCPETAKGALTQRSSSPWYGDNLDGFRLASASSFRIMRSTVDKDAHGSRQASAFVSSLKLPLGSDRSRSSHWHASCLTRRTCH